MPQIETELLEIAMLLALEEQPVLSAAGLATRGLELVALGEQHMKQLGLALRARRQN